MWLKKCFGVLKMKFPVAPSHYAFTMGIWGVGVPMGRVMVLGDRGTTGMMSMRQHIFYVEESLQIVFHVNVVIGGSWTSP